MTSICIVDDDEDVREVFSIFIEENYPDIDITECGNGYEALDEINQKKFDLLISDLRMPDMDGEELIRRLDQYNENKPDHILILTGYLGEIAEDTAKHKNITFLTKPFKENVFKAFIRKNLKLIDKPTLDATNQKKMSEELSNDQNRIQQTGLEFIEPFIDVTISFLNSISNANVHKSKVYIKKYEQSTEIPFEAEIATTVGLRSLHIEGSLGLLFKQESFLQLSNQFNQKQDHEINNDNAHFLGQIIKKIIKETTKILEVKNFSISYDGPYHVIYGEQINIHHFQKGPILVTEFNSDFGPLAIELLIKGK